MSDQSIPSVADARNTAPLTACIYQDAEIVSILTADTIDALKDAVVNCSITCEADKELHATIYKDGVPTLCNKAHEDLRRWAWGHAWYPICSLDQLFVATIDGEEPRYYGLALPLESHSRMGGVAYTAPCLCEDGRIYLAELTSRYIKPMLTGKIHLAEVKDDDLTLNLHLIPTDQELDYWAIPAHSTPPLRLTRCSARSLPRHPLRGGGTPKTNQQPHKTMTTRRKRPLSQAQRTQGEYEARMRRMARAQVIISIILQLYKDRMQVPSYKAVRRMSEEIGISDRSLYNYIYGYCAPSMATLKVLDHYYQHTTSHASANELSRILASIPERPLICNAGEAIEMPSRITTSDQSAPCNNM